MTKLFNEMMVFLGLGNIRDYTVEQWVWIVLAVGFIAYIFYNRKKYVSLFDSAVVMAETSFNHGDNQVKMNAAINYIKKRTEILPLFAKITIRYFLSKKRIVTIIERTLQKFSDVFGSGRKVDIKGNE